MNHRAEDTPRAETHVSSSEMETFLEKVEFSFTSTLSPDPQARPDGRDHRSREVRSGHYYYC